MILWVGIPISNATQKSFFTRLIKFNWLMSLLVFGALAGLALFYFGTLRFEEPGPLQSTRSIVVKEGSSVARIAQQNDTVRAPGRQGIAFIQGPLVNVGTGVEHGLHLRMKTLERFAQLSEVALRRPGLDAKFRLRLADGDTFAPLL